MKAIVWIIGVVIVVVVAVGVFLVLNAGGVIKTAVERLLAVFDQHLGVHLIRVDTRHTGKHLADRVAVDGKVHDDPVIRRDLRRDLQTQHCFFERYRGRAAGGRLLIRNLLSRLDQGLFLIGGDQLRASGTWLFALRPALLQQ